MNANNGLTFEVGSKFSLSICDSEKNENSDTKLYAYLVSNTGNSKNSTNFIDPEDCLEKTWIQIGENERVYGNKADPNGEKIYFVLKKSMIEDFIDTKMMYAGIKKNKYNIKTREISLDVVRKIASML